MDLKGVELFCINWRDVEITDCKRNNYDGGSKNKFKFIGKVTPRISYMPQIKSNATIYQRYSSNEG